MQLCNQKNTAGMCSPNGERKAEVHRGMRAWEKYILLLAALIKDTLHKYLKDVGDLPLVLHFTSWCSKHGVQTEGSLRKTGL